MNLRWFISHTMREAARLRREAKRMRKHAWKLLSAQRDILSADAIQNVQKSMDNLHAATRSAVSNGVLQEKMKGLEDVANKWFKPYPQAAMRENVEVLLVAIAVAMGIRTFIAQPFKIPTGSMQPTLYGVTSNPNFKDYPLTPVDAGPDPDFEVQPLWKATLLYWFTGVGYDFKVAKADGQLRAADDAPQKFLLFNLKQRFQVGPEWYTVWFPPDNLLRRAGLVERSGQPTSRVFKKGETILKMKSYSGDHLFVDRLTYNFRRPTRGEIIVFETKDIAGMDISQQGQFYIKRLVALGDEKVRIGDDQHVYINGKRLDSTTPHFENVYGFPPSQP